MNRVLRVSLWFMIVVLTMTLGYTLLHYFSYSAIDPVQSVQQQIQYSKVAAVQEKQTPTLKVVPVQVFPEQTERLDTKGTTHPETRSHSGNIEDKKEVSALKQRLSDMAQNPEEVSIEKVRGELVLLKELNGTHQLGRTDIDDLITILDLTQELKTLISTAPEGTTGADNIQRYSQQLNDINRQLLEAVRKITPQKAVPSGL